MNNATNRFTFAGLAIASLAWNAGAAIVDTMRPRHDAAAAIAEFDPTRVLVRATDKATAAQIAEADKRAGIIKVVYDYALVPGLRCVEVAPGRVDAAVMSYRAQPAIAYAHRDLLCYADEQTTPYGITNVNAPDVWPATRGIGAVVAVLDTGFDFGHPDLPSPILSTSFIPGESEQDGNSHGTHCSGTVLGLDNDIGVVGVAPMASLMIGKVLANSGFGATSGIIAGMDWAVINHTNIISMSLGGNGYEQAFADACTAAIAANITVIAAAGNGNTSEPLYPAAYPGVIAVAAVDSNNQRASFSNFGSNISVSAPGVDVLSTIPTGDVSWLSVQHQAQPLTGSADGTASGLSIDCGLGGSADDFPPTVAGNIALIRRGGGILFATKAANAEAAGAVGVIIANNFPGSFSGTLNGSSSVPVLGISMEDGDDLLLQGEIATTISTSGGHGYGTKSGTSMACPHVAGVAALLVSEFGASRITPDLIRTALEGSATDLGDPGRDDYYGFGLVNAAAARLYLAGILPPDCGFSFSPTTTYAAGQNPFAVTAGDLNGDGLPELVVANSGTDTISVYINTGDGTYGPATEYHIGYGVANVAIGDFNRDGIPDLAAVAVAGNVSILLGNGDASFAEPVLEMYSPDWPYDVKVGDVNGDGIADFVVPNFQGDSVSVVLGYADGTFSFPITYAVGSHPDSIALGDLTGDGILDIVTANQYSNDISVLEGHGDGTFDAAWNRLVGSAPSQVAVADLNQDGYLDVVTTNLNSQRISVLLSIPGSFSQWASGVLGFSSQWSPDAWAAFHTLGEPDTFDYCDCLTAWAPAPANGSLEFVSLGFASPCFASGLTIRETQGNGFVTRVDVIDLDGMSHMVWSGVDPSLPGTPVDFMIDWPQTDYMVTGVTIYVDTDHDLSTWEEIDAVSLRGVNSAHRTLSTAVDYAANHFPIGIAIGDLDGDGHVDIATGSASDQNVVVLRGYGDGTFGGVEVRSIGEAPTDLAIADLNGDGKLDLATANYFTGSMSVLLNNNEVAGFAQQPQNQNARPGDTVTFSVVASGTGPFTYQWRHSGIPIDGAVFSTLELANVSDADAGSYDVQISGWCHPSVPTTSRTAILTIGTPCPADFNQDGGVDGADVDAFFAAWESGDSAADVNQDGGVDGSDVDVFFTAWEAGGC